MSLLVSSQGGSSQTATILASASVVISLTSLFLSWKTWRHQCHLWEEYQKILTNKETIVQISQARETNNDLETSKLRQLSETKKISTSERSRTSDKNISTTSSIAITDDKALISENNNQEETPKKNGHRATLESQMLSQKNKGMMVQPIGTVRSIYRLCVGTPRQGLLAPHARGRLELSLSDHQSAMDAVIGLEQYSHIWILFVFHLNTLPKNQKVSAKISPPALGGTKLGVLATRSPHRFNPIGITLAKLDRVEIRSKSKRKGGNSARVVLHISGLDLVDGTPVLDIKPFVPHYDTAEPAHNLLQPSVRLPPWVSEGLATRRNVLISDSALQELKVILAQNETTSNNTKSISPLEFYGGSDESAHETMEHVLACIREVLSIDVRSAFQTKKARQGKYQAERARRLLHNQTSSDTISTTSESNAATAQQDTRDDDNGCNPKGSTSTNTCTQQLDNLLLHYTVSGADQVQRATSEGSGAEDQVCVTSIAHVKWQPSDD